ncbi:MAG: phosphoglycerate mutase [Candidatus Schekmanbacteria bacterium RIFCSPHIGHO2_02_FULL_38_11]|uniref:Phosphoglycerate mutase n=1 Tax=Candidatus Schekmanbacteria bacterium RIFCSPLOWO2_12_FULL_38_15 TaxID=1817883 RepID=A0A1F7SNX2_9BACT|nr:MAG: phosphoglycerate mutase [Candidatus Schekmanbacteria bacterium RIFCSPLOWO2_02_FULL_38_14]OGL50426.1 MAG: phosphoglycerate mutase [Candidatus Schekmanbacteria bacterium RIFCSPHIGHO2_02_FULL_38_11]OGL55485.1 MAG: phosphoglycerate mutase [Candidatus Schekmanbacteria bacterium RIFCSPLOWO2_12_FULL_38_15]
MVPFNIMKNLSTPTDSKILFIVLDGLSGLPDEKRGKTELEQANIPNLDSLAADSVCGMSVPVAHGITPGSGPSHLSLFGYDPLKYEVGRGILEALGIDFPLEPSDVAFRINFATVDENNIVTDRRAGRISSEKCKEICEELDKIKIEGVEIFVRAVKEHRAAMILRGKGLAGNIADTDPQRIGLKVKKVIAIDSESKKTAALADEFVERAKEVLKKHYPANMLMLRGASKHEEFPSMQEIYKLNPAAIATYPMYKGIVRLIGMNVLDAGETYETEIETLKSNFSKYDFFYFHYKKTDSTGEDGDFERKVKALEDFDKKLPEILSLNPDVVVLTGDHSTPSVLKAHSWHSVPVLINSKYCRKDEVKVFNETECTKGGLGTIQATDIMPLAMANALKLLKFGA